MAKPKNSSIYNKLRPFTFNKPILAAFVLMAVVVGVAYVGVSRAAVSWEYHCNGRTLSLGSRDTSGAYYQCVHQLQWVLDQDDVYGKALWPQECGGYPYHLTTDGIFGSKTLADVKTFQKWHHLSIDGVVGPNTWGALKYYRPYYYHYRCDNTIFNGYI